jgi:hypothetical protein
MRFRAFPINTVRRWAKGHVVKSDVGWSKLKQHVRHTGYTTLHADVDALRVLLAPDDESKRTTVQSSWSQLFPDRKS